MQNAGCHTAIKHFAQTATSMAGQGNDVGFFRFRRLDDFICNRSMADTYSDVDTLLLKHLF